MFDYLIVGAGFAGSVMAERLAADAGKKVLIIDKRNHVGGNAYDHYDEAGVLIHKYGPHIFHTNSREVFEYLSRFTEWRQYQHRVQAWVDGQLLPIPINLSTINQMYGLRLTSFELNDFFESLAEKRPVIKTSEDVIVSKVGRELYRRFYEGYTLKQWQRHPRDLDASVCGRVPIRTNRDDRYLSEEFQVLPKDGFTAMFGRMLDASPRVELHLGVDFLEACQRWRHRHLIFTGPVDEYFKRRYGALPYRSLRFEHESFTAEQLKAREPIAGKPGFWQPAVQVNYPDADVPFTRGHSLYLRGAGRKHRVFHFDGKVCRLLIQDLPGGHAVQAGLPTNPNLGFALSGSPGKPHSQANEHKRS